MPRIFSFHRYWFDSHVLRRDSRPSTAQKGKQKLIDYVVVVIRHNYSIVYIDRIRFLIYDVRILFIDSWLNRSSNEYMSRLDTIDLIWISSCLLCYTNGSIGMIILYLQISLSDLYLICIITKGIGIWLEALLNKLQGRFKITTKTVKKLIINFFFSLHHAVS